MAEIKRLNYFTYQFLVAKDFQDEQAYHRDMRWRHNRLMHSWGVAEGLDVSKTGDKLVAVSPGIAIDSKGQEIVLPLDPPPVPISLSTFAANSVVHLVISFVEVFDPNDRYTAGGVDDFIRKTERATLTAQTQAPPTDGSVIPLARITLDGSGNVDPAKIDHSVRTLAGAIKPDIKLRSLTLMNAQPETAANPWPKLTSNAANNTSLTGSLSVQNNLTVGGGAGNSLSVNGNLTTTGSAGIGTTDPRERLQIGTGITLHDGGHKLIGFGWAPTENRVLQKGFPAEIRWDPDNGNLSLGIDSTSRTVGQAPVVPQIMVLSRGNALFGGNVGIGVAPTQKLHVAGNAIVNNVFLGDVGHGPAWAGFSHRDVVDKASYGLLQSADGLFTLMNKKSGGGYLGFRVDNSDKMVIDDKGNVGIGTATPFTKLHVVSATGPEATGYGNPMAFGQHIEIAATQAWGLKDSYGMLSSWDSDCLFVGLKSEGSNRKDAVIAWGDDGDDLLRFLFLPSGNPGPAPVEVMRLNSAGNVGIGMITPVGRLSVAGTAGEGQAVQIDNREIKFRGDGVAHFSIYANKTSGTLTFENTGSSHLMNAAGTVLMALAGGGNVGIGMSDPKGKLHLSGPFPDIFLAGQTTDNKDGMRLHYNDAANSRTAVIDVRGASLRLRGESRGTGSGATDRLVIDLAVGTTTIFGDLAINGRITSGKGGFVMDQFINRLGEAVEEGDVVVIGSNQSTLSYGQRDNIPIPEVDLAQQAYDTAVCGIVYEVYGEMRPPSDENESGPKPKGGKKKVKLMPQQFAQEEMEKLNRAQVQPEQLGWMVTLGAFAHCKVDADIAPIKIGDLLTSSPTKGHAQKVLDPAKAVGAIVGKALGSLKNGKGKIPVMVLMQ